MAIRYRTILLVILALVSLVLTVFPDPSVGYLNWILKPPANMIGLQFDTIQTEPASRFFAVLCPILVSLLTVDVVQQIQAARTPRLAPVAVRFQFNPAGLEEPYRSIAIYTQLPSFPDQNTALQHLAKSVVLANHRLIYVRNEPELDAVLANQSVVGLIMDARFREDALRRARRGVAVYLAERHELYASTRGNPITLRIGTDMLEVANIYRTALPLAHAYVPDVAKSVGFHGTWATTYGLLTIREDFKGHAAGVYWYGYGQISDGTVNINVDDNSVSLKFKWDQTSNYYTVGTRHHGDGEFLMAAGSDVFFGYWYRDLDPNHLQLWSGTRLSSDIIRDIGTEVHSLRTLD